MRQFDNPLTVAAGATLSSAQDIDVGALVGLIFPGNFTDGNVTLRVGMTEDDIGPLTVNGEAVTIAAIAGNREPLQPYLTVGWKWVQLEVPQQASAVDIQGVSTEVV